MASLAPPSPSELNVREFAQASAALRRPMTAAELRMDVARAKAEQLEAKHRLAAAIEDEKVRVIDVKSRGLVAHCKVTQPMLDALLWIYDRGVEHATAELHAIGVEIISTRAYAETSNQRIGRLANRRLQPMLGGITVRIDQEARGLGIAQLARTTMVQRLAQTVPGPLDAASRLVSSGFTAGLSDTFDGVEADVAGWQYTAVMDDAVCDECEAHDGEEYELLDDALAVLPDFGPNPDCFGEGRCRCRLVPTGPATPVDASTSYPTPSDGPGPSLYGGGNVEPVERFDPVDIAILNTSGEGTSETNAIYNREHKRLEAEVSAVTWPTTTAQVEAYDAITRLGVDDVRVLRDEKGKMLGVVDFNAPHKANEIADALTDPGLSDAERAELQKMHDYATDPTQVIGVNHLASTGEVAGTGARLMREVAKVAAERDRGVGLNSLNEAKGFYERLGMHAEPGSSNYYWTKEEARHFAETGKPPSGSITIADSSTPADDYAHLPPHARQPIESLTIAEAQAQRDKLVRYLRPLRGHVKAGTRSPHPEKIPALERRIKALDEHIAGRPPAAPEPPPPVTPPPPRPVEPPAPPPVAPPPTPLPDNNPFARYARRTLMSKRAAVRKQIADLEGIRAREQRWLTDAEDVRLQRLKLQHQQIEDALRAPPTAKPGAPATPAAPATSANGLYAKRITVGRTPKARETAKTTDVAIDLLDRVFPDGFGAGRDVSSPIAGAASTATKGLNAATKRISSNAGADYSRLSGEIRMNTRHNPAADSFWHEFGHFTDHRLIPGGGRVTFASNMAPSLLTREMNAVMDAIDTSRAIGKVKEAKMGRGPAYSSRRHAAYLDTPHERFARAFQQWMTQRAAELPNLSEGERAVIARAEHSIERKSYDSYGTQWASHDFAPIAKAMDALFRSLGFLR